MASSGPIRLRWLVERAPAAASAIVAAWGLVVLIGWLADIELLKSLLHPHRIAMNPATATCFIFVAIALFLLRREPVLPGARIFADVLAFTIATVGLARLFAYTAGFDFRVDQIIFSSKVGANVMAPNTAVAFILMGLGFMILDVRVGRDQLHVSQLFVLATGAIALLSLTGYLFQIVALYGISGYIPMALNTSICFALLVVGAVSARPTREPLAMLLDDTVGGAVARRLLPAAFILPLGLAWLRLFGERHGWFSAGFGMSLMVLSLIVLLNALIWWNAKIQRRVDLQRRSVGEALGASEARYRAVVAQASEGITLVDAETLRIVETNHALAKLLGYSPQELVGRPISEFIVDSETGVASRAQKTLTSSTPAVLRRQYRRRDGSVVDVEKSATVLQLEGRRMLCTVIHDITERLRAEAELQDAMRAEREAHEKLKATQSALVQSEKLAGLGQMVAGVAHEINNPLAFVSNNVAVLQRDLAGMLQLLKLYAEGDQAVKEKFPELAEQIREQAERMDLAYTSQNLADIMSRSRDGLKRIQQIVKDLRDFARLDRDDHQDADINAGIESTINIIRGVAKKKQVTIETQLQPLPPVTCYPAKINQVVMNLITNARDASHEGGRVTVRSSRDGEQVRIEVIDEGCGIDPAVSRRIFDPFYTTKKIGEGTGLGLSISYGIVKDHGGRIDVESEIGRGSRFTVVLPLRAAPAKAQTSLV